MPNEQARGKSTTEKKVPEIHKKEIIRGTKLWTLDSFIISNYSSKMVYDKVKQY